MQKEMVAMKERQLKLMTEMEQHYQRVERDAQDHYVGLIEVCCLPHFHFTDSTFSQTIDDGCFHTGYQEESQAERRG
jgi:hypothetical protein